MSHCSRRISAKVPRAKRKLKSLAESRYRARIVVSRLCETVTRHRRPNHRGNAGKRSHRSDQYHVLASERRNQTLGVVDTMHAFTGKQPNHDDGPANIINRFRKRWRLFKQGNPYFSKATTLAHAVGQLLGGDPRSFVLSGPMCQQHNRYLLLGDSARLGDSHDFIDDNVDQRGIESERWQDLDEAGAVIVPDLANESRQRNTRKIAVSEKQRIHNNVTRRERSDRIDYAGSAFDESGRDFRRYPLCG
jgi:hypothetical protein